MEEQKLKIAARISLGTLFVLLLGAIFFYKERMFFGDAPWIAFLVINKKALAIQEHRYGSFITQLFPLICSHLRLPIKVILIAYSLSFNLFYFVSGLILYKWRQYSFVVLSALFYTLMAADSYFWTNNELYQGVSWMLLMIGFVLYRQHKKRCLAFEIPAFVILAFIAVFTHPLIVLLAGFCWVYLFIEQKEPIFKGKRILIFSVLLLGIIGMKTYTSFNGWYDSERIKEVAGAGTERKLTALWSETALVFYRTCLRDYWLFLLFFLSGIVALIRNKRYAQSAWIIACSAGYIVLISLSYPFDNFKFYIESEWMALIIITMLPFITYVLPSLNRKVMISGLVLVFMIRLCYIGMAAPLFEQRYQRAEKIVHKMREKNLTKIILPKEADRSSPEKELIMSWALPNETMMISKMEGDIITRTAIVVLSAKIAERTPVSLADMMTCTFAIPNQELDHHYFKLDTTKAYVIMPYSELLQ